MSIESADDLSGMQRVGRSVAESLQAMKASVRAGMTTAELDAVGAAVLRKHGARSAPQHFYGFPGVTCISVNDEIVHGIPGPRRLAPGDVVKIDVTAELNGYVADAATTLLLPPAGETARRLRRSACEALREALDSVRSARPVSAIGRAVEDRARRDGFSIVRELCGHGVGRHIHEAPDVPNYYDPYSGDVLTEGLVIAVEPMLSALSTRAAIADDGWTIRTRNGCIAVHEEHTIVVTDKGPLILTG